MSVNSLRFPVQGDVTPGPSQGAATDVSGTEPDTLATLQLLDDEQEWTAFSRPAAQMAGCWESNVMIEGMHCAACALSIEDSLVRVPGVLRVEVSAGSHRAKVVWDAQAVSPSGWMQAVQRAGYRALPANDAFARERRQVEARKAQRRVNYPPSWSSCCVGPPGCCHCLSFCFRVGHFSATPGVMCCIGASAWICRWRWAC